MALFDNLTPSSSDGPRELLAKILLHGIQNPPVQAPIEVADATERKTLATYTGQGITPFRGMYVVQDDEPNVLWQLLGGTDVTVDANWYGFPRTNADGELEGPVINRSGTATANDLIVPHAGEIIVDTDRRVVRVGSDGVTAGGNIVLSSASYLAGGAVGALVPLSAPGNYPAIASSLALGLVPGVKGHFKILVSDADGFGSDTSFASCEYDGTPITPTINFQFVSLDGGSTLSNGGVTGVTIPADATGLLELYITSTSVSSIQGYYRISGSLSVA